MLFHSQIFCSCHKFSLGDAPTKSKGQQSHQFVHSFSLAQVRCFKVKAPSLQATEQHLYLPSLFVVSHCALWRFISDHDDIFLGCSQTHHVQGETPNFSLFVQHHHSISFGSEQPVDLQLLMASVAEHFRIVTNTNPKRDFLIEQKLNPIFSDEFAVCGHISDLGSPEKPEKTLHQLDSFICVRAASLVQKSPEDGNTKTIVSNAEDKKVDVLFAEFPVGSVNAKKPFVLKGKEFGDDLGKEVKIKIEFGKKPLNAFVVRVDFCFSLEFLGKSVERSSLGIDEGKGEEAYKCNTGLIPGEKSAKLLLQKIQFLHGLSLSMVGTVFG